MYDRTTKLIGTLVTFVFIITAWYFMGTAEQIGDSTELQIAIIAIIFVPFIACFLGWIVAGLINMIVSWVRY